MGKTISFLLVFLLPLVLTATSDEDASLIGFKSSSIELDPSNRLGNWKIARTVSPNPCSWTGVDCSSDGHVVRLNLSNLGLAGNLRMDTLMDLPKLREVDLHGNFFYGNLSHSRGDRSSSSCRLKTVDLSHNNFNESIAGGFLSSCNNLVSLNLSSNSITGGIFPIGSSSLRLLDLSRNRISDPKLLNYTMSDCRKLVYLNISGNNFAGELPDASGCNHLRILDLSQNPLSRGITADFFSQLPASLNQLILSNCNLTGHFSAVSFGSCDKLRMLDFSSNSLSGGGLPPSLSSCRKLKWLDLSNNHLQDVIPHFLGNFSRLWHLSLSNNKFSGDIPPDLGHLCPSLRELDLSSNSLTGGIPSTFTSCSDLCKLDLSTNQLSGDFIGTVVSTLISLKYLDLSFNNISGVVPLESLKNCSLLEVINLSSNEFTGTIPAGLCSSLRYLQKLLMPNNFLTGDVPLELANCANLRSIDLSFNDIIGAIPSEIFALPNLVDFLMWANNISGEIPDNLCSIGSGLDMLILNHNDITGSIPGSITRCRNLKLLSLSGNYLTGTIPSGIGGLHNLAILQLGNNSITGEIPPELGNCRNLIWLDLNLNNLSGSIPPSLSSQAGLIQPGIISGREFAFLRNEGGTSCPGAGIILEFTGIRPERLERFPLVHSCPRTRMYTGMSIYTFKSNGSMIYIDLSYNSLAGTIPESYGVMEYLQVLNLGHNQLTGTIPKSFVGLKWMGALDLSHNQLTGFIPGELEKLSRLKDLDVSNNNLTGSIPTSGQLMTFSAARYENNSGLCGVPLPPCWLPPEGGRDPNLDSSSNSPISKEALLIPLIITVLFIGSLLLVLHRMMMNDRKQRINTARISGWKFSGNLEPLSINVATFEKPLRKLTFAHLLRATNGFSSDSLIGSGGSGDVYKAQLEDGSFVAVKKLINIAGKGDREFTAEMETIGKIKHRNLVPLLGYCRVGDERLLVYDYMPNGSLELLLHDQPKGTTKLNWAARKKIAIGAARGLAFLHHSCIPHIIYRDMKSGNVLLDGNLEARVSDFGMARLVNALDTHLSVSTLAGTPGYVPPDYYQSFRSTTKGDVYSYGVILLELLSGKRPIDSSDFGDNNLVGWTKQMVRENRASEVFDRELIGNKSGDVELHRYLKIACDCLDDRPLRRPTMIQVVAMLKEFQKDSDGDDALDGLSIGSSNTIPNPIDEQTEKVT